MIQGCRMLKAGGRALLLSAALVAALSGAASAEDITITCYVDNWSVGNIMVGDVREAARVCNMIYYDCKGKCIGCFYDSDYADDFCGDVNGRTFLR